MTKKISSAELEQIIAEEIENALVDEGFLGQIGAGIKGAIKGAKQGYAARKQQDADVAQSQEALSKIATFIEYTRGMPEIEKLIKSTKIGQHLFGGSQAQMMEQYESQISKMLKTLNPAELKAAVDEFMQAISSNTQAATIMKKLTGQDVAAGQPAVSASTQTVMPQTGTQSTTQPASAAAAAAVDPKMASSQGQGFINQLMSLEKKINIEPFLPLFDKIKNMFSSGRAIFREQTIPGISIKDELQKINAPDKDKIIVFNAIKNISSYYSKQSQSEINPVQVISSMRDMEPSTTITRDELTAKKIPDTAQAQQAQTEPAKAKNITRTMGDIVAQGRSEQEPKSDKKTPGREKFIKPELKDSFNMYSGYLALGEKLGLNPTNHIKPMFDYLVSKGLLYKMGSIKEQENPIKIWQDHGIRTEEELRRHPFFTSLINDIHAKTKVPKNAAIIPFLIAIWKQGKLVMPKSRLDGPEYTGADIQKILQNPDYTDDQGNEIQGLEESKRWQQLAGILKD